MNDYIIPPQQSLASALAELGDKAAELDTLQTELTIYFQDTYHYQLVKIGNAWSVNKPQHFGYYGEEADYYSHSFTEAVLWILAEYNEGDHDEVAR